MVNCRQKFIILSYTIYSAGQHITLHGSKEELQQEETRESTETAAYRALWEDRKYYTTSR
jgi:hypothetical protein